MEKGTVDFIWIKGDDNVVDGLTKPLEYIKFQRFRELLRMVKTSESTSESQKPSRELEDELNDYVTYQSTESAFTTSE